MGNQLIKDTHIDKEPLGKTGIGLQWEMYSGHKLDKSKTPATIFLFDKKELLKASSSVREEALTLIKKEPQSLARFKHPNILSLLDPLLEDPKSMGFVTEATKGSLHSFIQTNRASEIFPTEIDTKFHILELAETLSFLHNDVKSCHLAISPENVYVLNDEKWKLGGFSFVTQITQGSSTDTNINFSKNSNIRPSLNFCAPEVANSSSKCSFASDIFSLGCLIYTLYKINQEKSTTKSPYLMNVSSVNEVQDFAKNMNKQNFTCIPNEIRQFIVRMLSPEPSMRPTISELVNHHWFKDPFIQTVKHLETLYQRELAQQQSFLKGLNQIVLRFEKKFVISKILPLLNDLIKNEKLAASIIPIYFSLVEGEGSAILTKQEFHNVVWPSIKALTTGKGIPAQALYLLIQNSQILVEIGDMKEIQTIFVPLLTKAFECGVAKLQILALKKTEALFSKMEYNVSKSQLLPRILNMCVDANIDIRKEALILLSKIYQIFDKTTINDQVLNTLEKVRKMNNNYKINMTLLQIFEGISKNIGVETIANKILVSMIPMLVDQSLSKTEYKAYLKTVNAYLKRIEDEQNKFYEGKPDLPEEEANDSNNLMNFEPSKPVRKSDGTEFNFLDVFNGGSTGTGGGSSSTGVPANSGGGWGGGIDDFDFTSFDEQFKSPTNTNNPGISAGNFGNSPLSPSQTAPKKTTNIDAFNFTGQSSQGQQNPTFPKPTGSNQNQPQPQKTLASLNIKKPSNVNTGAGIQQQQQQSGGFNFGQPQPQSQPSFPSQQSNFNFTAGPTTSSNNKWDILDNELGSAGLSSNNNQGFGGSNNNNNFNMMSSSNSNNNNQFQFNSNPPSYNPQPASQGWNSQPQNMFQGMNMNNKSNNNNKPSSDDFFDSFNVPNTNQKKNTQFNINTNNNWNNNNNNDLL